MRSHSAIPSRTRPRALAGFGAVLALAAASQCAAAIVWDSTSDQIQTGLPDWNPAASVKEPVQVHVSPGGTIFYTWMDFSGVLSDSTSADSTHRCCDGRLAFASNGLCASYQGEYECTPGQSPDSCSVPCDGPRACRYYYLPRALSSIYVRPRFPDGTLGAVEEVTPANYDSLTAPFVYDAAVGPDGSLHVVWEDVVPNVPVGLAPYSEVRRNADYLPLEGADALMYNKCGRDVDNNGRADSVRWIIGPNDSTCFAACGDSCDEINPAMISCTDSVGCWRQLTSMSVVCYRRRYPTGAWGAVHRHIAPYTDVYDPDTLRTCRVPVIAVDDEGWVYVAWDQKAAEFPSCAWRRIFPRGTQSYGPGGSQSQGDFNMGLYDAYFRKWSSSTHPDGPDSTSIVLRVSAADTLPDEMPQDYMEDETFQDDAPWDIMVAGSGAAATVHLIVARAPSIGGPCPLGGSGRELFDDCDLYTYLLPESTAWAPRRLLMQSMREQHACAEPCDAPPIAFGKLEMGLSHFVKNSDGPVHVLIGANDIWTRNGVCACPYADSCFTNRGSEVLHRELAPGDPEEWAPPFSEEAQRVSIYDGDMPVNEFDNWPVGVIASDGSIHVFWNADGNTIMHVSPIGAIPDTVVAFTTPPDITALDVAERNGIFHLLIAVGDLSSALTPNGEDLPHPDAQGTTLYYKRGVLDLDYVGTLQCDSTKTVVGNTTYWSGSLSLCADHVVGECETLVVQPGTTVRMAQPVEIIVKGKLVADGTSGAITFRSFRTPERAAAGTWDGIRLTGGSARAVLKNVSISGALYGVKDEIGSNPNPSSCVSADGPGRLSIENCRFAYNSIAGVAVTGDANTGTPDLLRVRDSEFLTNFEGIKLENVSVPDTGNWVIRGNRFRFNDWSAISIVGRYGRTVVIDSNLVQGLGADEFISDLPDSNWPDTGIRFTETRDLGRDSLRVTRNALYRIQDAGVRVKFVGNGLYAKSAVVIGGSADTTGNFFYRVGTGIDAVAATASTRVRHNVLLHYGLGLSASAPGIDLGQAAAGQGGLNYFDFCTTDVTSPPFWDSLHIDVDPGSTDSLYAHQNWWCPIVANVDTTICYDSAYFSGVPIALGTCINNQGLPGGYPASVDRWSVIGLALKQWPELPRDEIMRPRWVELYANIPNPFNPLTEIRFDIPQRLERASLVIYDVQGRRIKTLVEGPIPAGPHAVYWNGEDDSGQAVASGIYFYRLLAGQHDLTRRMVLLK